MGLPASGADAPVPPVIRFAAPRRQSRLSIGFRLLLALQHLIVVYFAHKVLRRRFDPFAPIWLFLVGYVQVYVVQAITYHEWATRVRGRQVRR